MSSNLIGRRLKTICVWLMCIAGSFAFLGASPLHPFRGADVLTDSAVFKTVAMMMKKGYMPYRDTFDHKGPLIYIINYLGNCILAYRGVFVIEWLFLAATFVCWFKLAKLVCEKGIAAAISVCCGAYVCYGYFEGGNLTEEYALLFISVALYIFVQYLLCDENTNSKLGMKIAISGFCFGMVCMLRINMVTVWVVFCAAITIKLLLEKEYVKFGRFVAYFLAGAMISLLPFCIWLIANGCFGNFIDAYFKFNMMYSKSGTGMGTTSGKFKTFFTFANQNLYIISIGVCVVLIGTFLNCKRNVCKIMETKIPFLALTYLVYLIFNLIMESLSGVVLGHYAIVSAPAVVLPVGMLFEICQGNYLTLNGNNEENVIGKGTGNSIAVILLALFLTGYMLPGRVLGCFADLADYAARRNEVNHAEITMNLRDVISTNTNHEDKITVYGNNDLLYVVSDRVHATRYSYQYPIGDVNEEILDEYFEDLAKEPPKLIAVCPGHLDERIEKFIDEYNYNLIYAENSENSNLGYLVYDISTSVSRETKNKDLR